MHARQTRAVAVACSDLFATRVVGRRAMTARVLLNQGTIEPRRPPLARGVNKCLQAPSGRIGEDGFPIHQIGGRLDHHAVVGEAPHPQAEAIGYTCSGGT